MQKCPFSERFLQIIWNERLLVPRAQCTDGKGVHVLSTGLWNRQPGPDFQDAAAVVGAELKHGDVEVHRVSSDWFQHGHSDDPRYGEVFLHVVWEDDGGGPPLPTLELKNQLQPSWRKVLVEVEAAFYPHAREVPPGACALRWALTEDERLREILRSAGYSRMLRRGQRLLRLAARSSEDQALYEQVFEGLGYAANREAFRTLAQLLPLNSLTDIEETNSLMARYFGMAGLLPDTTQTKVLPAFRPFVAQAWREWWASGLTAGDLHWNRAGSRPLNSIHRRLAGGIFWLQQCHGHPAQWLLNCAARAENNPKILLDKLLETSVRETPWDTMRDFATPVARQTALLGRERRRDLAVNTFLPFLVANAELQKDEPLRELARAAWEKIPRTQENRLLRDAVRRFLAPPSRARELLRRASQQQGMMDIFQNFCLALDHACQECPFVVPPKTSTQQPETPNRTF